MANEQDKNPTTSTESDISKAQSQQQPPNQASQQDRETGERQGQGEFAQDTEAGAADEGLQGDTLTQQRTDIEGASLKAPGKGESAGGFVGGEGRKDSSSELVEDQDFEKDGQGAPEGK